MNMAATVEIRVLGPVEVRRDGRPIPVAGAKPRAVLTLLGLYSGQVVAADTLQQLLWGDEAPRTAHKALQTHISVLRRALGEGVILTKGTGWHLSGAATDAESFTAHLRRARRAAREGRPAEAAAAFTEAAGLWRGAPELTATSRADAEATRWREEFETLGEDRVDALLACGQDAELIGELESQVAAAPLREQRWRQLMLALYRAGRQADALGAYQRARTLLADQLGVQPGAELRRLHSAILNQDSALSARRPPTDMATPPANGTTAGALPRPRTSFVGRRDELRLLGELLAERPLVTVVGPGGVGKTRLAVAAAEAAVSRFGDGVVFVDLAPVRAGFVLQAVAAALGIADSPQRPLDEAVRERLGRGRLLLVLDNCEHLVETVGQFTAGLLETCPHLVLLATSRERLGLPDEWVVSAPPLSVVSPETGGPKGSEAVTLFLDRANAIQPESAAALAKETDAIGELCARLDGLPLAIELAAGRCATLGIDGLAAGLADRLRLISGARGSQRHRSLRAMLDWSHELLDADERVVFGRLGVFVGGFDLAAAHAVAGDADRPFATVADLVGRLTGKNLLTHQLGRAGSRWRLPETVRVYALERLAAGGEEFATCDRHLTWAAATAADLEQRLEGGEPWRDGFDLLADDLRAALATAPVGAPAGYRLARALGHLAYARGFLFEAREHYEQAASRSEDARAVESLRAAAGVAYAEMRHAVAFDLLQRAAEHAGDTATRAICLASAVMLGARGPGGFPEPPGHETLTTLLDQARGAAGNSPDAAAHIAVAAAWHGGPVSARCDPELAAVALDAARGLDDPALLSAALDGVTTVALGQGRHRDGAAHARERLELLGLMPRDDPRYGGEIVDIFHMVTETALACGDLPGAVTAAQLARDDTLGRGVPILSSSRQVLPYTLCGDFDEALNEATEMFDVWERSGRPPSGWMAPAAYAAGLACGLRGDASGHAAWTERARQITRRPLAQGFAPFVAIRVALHAGDLATAVGHADALPPDRMGKFDMYARAISAETAVVTGSPEAAARLAAASVLSPENDWAAACLDRAFGRLHGDRAALERSITGWERIRARFERACTLLLIDERADEGRAQLRALGCRPPG